MSCVNTRLPEFIELAKKMDLSVGTLELIVHEFQNTEGNEGKYPSESYIMNRISGEPMTNASEEQVKLWDKKYSKPFTVKTISEARNIAVKAGKFFPKRSIKIISTNDGKFKVTVAKPLMRSQVTSKKTSEKVEDILKDPSGNKAKILNWVTDMQRQDPKLWEDAVNAMSELLNWSTQDVDTTILAVELLNDLSDRSKYDLTESKVQKEIDALTTIEEKAQKYNAWNRVKEAVKNFWDWVQRNIFHIKLVNHRCY